MVIEPVVWSSKVLGVGGAELCLARGPTEMPGEQFSALAAAEDDNVEIFGLRHRCFLSDDNEIRAIAVVRF
jgi:hypothetical protein